MSTQPTPVTIVEPPIRWPAFFADVFIGTVVTLIYAGFLVLLVPLVFPESLTYGQYVALLVIARLVIPRTQRIRVTEDSTFKMENK